jgi:hypothetical protein
MGCWFGASQKGDRHRARIAGLRRSIGGSARSQSPFCDSRFHFALTNSICRYPFDIDRTLSACTQFFAAPNSLGREVGPKVLVGCCHRPGLECSTANCEISVTCRAMPANDISSTTVFCGRRPLDANANLTAHNSLSGIRVPRRRSMVSTSCADEIEFVLDCG